MESVRDLPWVEPLLEWTKDEEAESRFRKLAHRPSRVLGYLTGVPWMVDTVTALNVRLMTRIVIDDELGDLIGLVVSQDNSCRYCFAAQRAVLRILGFSEDRIVQLEHDLTLSNVDPAVKAALEYSRKISRSDPLPSPADATALTAVGFDEASVREIASLAAIHSFFNRFSTIVALPPEGMEALPDRWWARAFRPLVALRMSKVRMRGVPERLRDDDRAGPYGFVVEALDGLPVAHEMRSAIDGMWKSDILSRRCKALMIAVVARSLGCTLSESESIDVLTSEGVAREDALAALDHLAWDGFTREEALLVPFARETVWYQAPRLQERARDVRDRLSTPEFIEAVGVVSVANTVCRLAAALTTRPGAS